MRNSRPVSFWLSQRLGSDLMHNLCGQTFSRQSQRAAFLSTNGGFTIIETMMAVAIGGILMLGTLTAISQSIKANQSVQLNIELNKFITEVTSALQNSNMCEASLNGTANLSKTTLLNQSPATLTVNRLKYPGAKGAILAQPNQPLPGTNLVKVNKMELTNYRYLGTKLGESEFMVDLSIQLEKGTANQSILGGNSVKPRVIPVLLRINDATGGVACNTVGLSSDQLNSILESTCKAAGGTWTGTSCAAASASQTCSTLGGTWDGSSCLMNIPKNCIALGGTVSGSNCVFPTGAPTQANGPSQVTGKISYLQVYQCPAGHTLNCVSTPIVGCVGQVSTTSTCRNSGWDSCSDSNATQTRSCTPVGRLVLSQ